ncbi:MAG: PfkB family carbohydrate kinase [Eubacteriales bacterium]|nr:PfkB family carbohydrate kinase [Eubacteriales bacterium]
MNDFDILIMGQLSLDINTDYGGRTERVIGGAVLASGMAADATGAKVAVLPKGNREVADPVAAFARRPSITVIPVDSPTCTSISNTYLTADRERRVCKAISHIAPYAPEDLPPQRASIYHIAGLMAGDISDEMIARVAQLGMAAVDVQCLLRRDEGGEMISRDWEGKRQYLPMIRFLKTDAAEAEILTGLTDRRAAAKQLFDWGAQEVMVTHNTEVILYDGQTMYACPLKPRNLTGRTGRGDTTFAGYLAKRLHCGIEESLRYAAALVSLKMETPGPFMGTEQDVLDYMRAFY